jgi:hypothetical protein
MSSYIVSRSDDTYHIFSDAAVTANDGTLYAIKQKTHVLSHMSAAYTTCGFNAWNTSFYADLCGCPTLDHFEDRAEEVFKKYLPTANALAEKENASPDIEFVIVGYSDRRGEMVCLAIGNRGNSAFLREACKIQQVTEDILNPPPDQRILDSLRPPDGFMLPRDGVLVMQAQRPYLSEGVGVRIGGHVQHTSISRHQISTRIAYRWNDKLGEKIAA